MLIIDEKHHAKKRCFGNSIKSFTWVSLVAFYGRENTCIVKLDTYLNSAKHEDSRYGNIFALKCVLLKPANFSSSFLKSNYHFYTPGSG